MSVSAQLKAKDLLVGGGYLHVNRLFIRHIDALDGDTVNHGMWARGHLRVPAHWGRGYRAERRDGFHGEHGRR